MRLWLFIAEQKHSNAVVAIFTLLLFITTTIYTVFAALQWRTMKDSLDETKAALHVSEQAYITTETPQMHVFHRKLTLGIINEGHIPSGKTVIINHEATEDGIDPAAAPKSERPIEAHGHRDAVRSIPVGNPFRLTINIPA